MKFRFSLKQVFALALVGAVVWTILLCAYWQYGWAIGAVVGMALFGLVGILSVVFAFVVDRVAFLIHRR